jgi:hypothetical protein
MHLSIPCSHERESTEAPAWVFFIFNLFLKQFLKLTWRGKFFNVEIVVHRSRSCRANACGVVVCFGRARDLDAAKRVRFGNKKAMMLIFKIILKRIKKIPPSHLAQLVVEARKSSSSWQKDLLAASLA